MAAPVSTIWLLPYYQVQSVTPLSTDMTGPRRIGVTPPQTSMEPEN